MYFWAEGGSENAAWGVGIGECNVQKRSEALGCGDDFDCGCQRCMEIVDNVTYWAEQDLVHALPIADWCSKVEISFRTVSYRT